MQLCTLQALGQDGSTHQVAEKEKGRGKDKGNKGPLSVGERAISD